MATKEQVIEVLRETPSESQRLRKDDFDLSNGGSGQRSRIATFEAESTLSLRRDAPMRLMFIEVEEFTTDGTADNTETFTLSNNLIETVNTADLVLYDDGTRVQPDAVDYGAESFDYTDSATGSTLHAYYVARDPVKVEIERRAPRAQGAVQDVVFDDVTSILHERNQNKEPPEFDFDHPLDSIVPRKWYIDVYAEGPVGFDWDDDGTNNPQDTEATNALLSLPVNRAKQDVPGLAQAVREHIIG
jgi:hypothetical protein